MTQVAFHTGVADKIGYACRLLRKVSRRRMRVRVVGAPQEIELLDRALWTFEPQDFLPHLRWNPGTPVRPALARTPVWLTTDAEAWPEGVAPAQVLVNLGSAGPDAAQAYERVVEIVSTDAVDRQAGRSRWRTYEAAGHALEHHVAGLE